MSTKNYKRGVSPALDRSSRRLSCGRSGGEQLAFRAQRAGPAQPAATLHRAQGRPDGVNRSRCRANRCLLKKFFPECPKSPQSWDKFGTIWDNPHPTPLTPTRKHLTLPVEFLTVRVSRLEWAHAFLALLITGSLVRVQLGEPVKSSLNTPPSRLDARGVFFCKPEQRLATAPHDERNPLQVHHRPTHPPPPL